MTPPWGMHYPLAYSLAWLVHAPTAHGLAMSGMPEPRIWRARVCARQRATRQRSNASGESKRACKRARARPGAAEPRQPFWWRPCPCASAPAPHSPPAPLADPSNVSSSAPTSSGPPRKDTAVWPRFVSHLSNISPPAPKSLMLFGLP
eukprot:2058500-Rhodomonas_salina.1